MADQSRAFYWTGIDADGARVSKRKIMAVSQQAAVATLMRDGATPVKVAGGGRISMNMEIGSGEVKFKWAQKADFARRLLQLLRAGVSLPAALTALGEDAPPKVAEMCSRLADDVTSGVSLAESMSQFPGAFDDVFVAYITAGEESGTLLTSLESLSQLLTKRASMVRKIKAVSAYPKLVGSTIGLMVVGILLFLVPRFAEIYDSVGADLPAPTQLMVKLSQNIVPLTSAGSTEALMTLPIPGLSGTSEDGSPSGLALNPFTATTFLVLALVAVVQFRRKVKENPALGVRVNRVLFRLPVLGALAHKSALYRWTVTLAGSLNAGVPAVKSLDLAARASGSPWLAFVTPDLVNAVQSGRSLSAEMGEHPDLFPVSVRTMATTGEATGDLDGMLVSVATSLDEDIDTLVAGLSSKIEVLLLVFLGVIVGGMLIVLYMPLLGLAGAISDQGTGTAA